MVNPRKTPEYERVGHPPTNQLPSNRLAYWNDQEQTVVIVNPHDPDGGTAFRPDDGKAYFDDLKE
jgi:filamentous hemagglutinin